MTELPRMRRVVTRAVILISPKTTKITFPFNMDDLARVKTLSGRKYHPDSPKHWTAPLCIESVEKLEKWGFDISGELKEFLMKSKVHVDNMKEINVPGLKMKLFPFQKKGVAFIEQKDGRALVADEMGLGKTIQAISYLQLHPKKRPVIIVVPASLKLNWEREYEMWIGKKHTQILSGKKSHSISVVEKPIIIINYDILSAWVEDLKKIKAQVLILDECHYIKNNKAQRTKAVKKIAKNIPHVIALSGTPIINRPIEMYNALRLINPTVVPSHWDYAMRYCGARHNGFGWDFNGATNTKELHDKLVNTIMIRRLKADVLSELPPKQRSILPLELSNQKEYDAAEHDFLNWLEGEKGKDAARSASRVEALAKIEALKQLTIKGKMKECIEWIENFLDSNGKLVVFCTHKKTVNDLMDKFGERAVKVDGSITGQKRQDAVDQFQADKSIRLFIGNIKAAGIGITLTAASSVAFLELGWSPGEHDQAEDRIHRIGQKAQSINIYYLLAAGTIEERIAKLLDKKRKVLSAVLDGRDVEETSLLSELMDEMKGEK